MRFYVLVFVLLQTLSGCGQEPEWLFIPRQESYFFQLGTDSLQVQRYQYDTLNFPFFVHLHHNEQTADSVLHHYLQRNGGLAIGLKNRQQRLVHFASAGVQYLFDPNRMFTPGGLQQSFRLYGPYKKQVADSVLQFARQVLALLPDSLPLIAMHNNTEGAYSLLAYRPGGVYAKEVKESFRNPVMDADDFVLTTDPALYRSLKAAAYNVVLQDNAKVADDGSLGYYFGKTGRSYVNIEAEHGHFDQQMRMLLAVLAYYENPL